MFDQENISRLGDTFAKPNNYQLRLFTHTKSCLNCGVLDHFRDLCAEMVWEYLQLSGMYFLILNFYYLYTCTSSYMDIKGLRSCGNVTIIGTQV